MKRYCKDGRSAALYQKIVICLVAALALVVMLCVALPIIPGAPYLRYEPSGAILLLAAVVVSPPAGLAAFLLKDALYFLLTGANIFGVLGDLLCTGTYIAAAAWCLRLRRNTVLPAVWPLLLATLAGTAVMIPANYLILFLEFGMTAATVTALLPAIIVFNLLKGVLNSVVYLLLIRPLSHALPSFRPTAEGGNVR